ncbi:ubiquitin-like domain-containing protein [Nocardioides panacisoli]|uniref:resuscitation-promoting factor n=1 Tax=Nocardioides panacisoli TaxID=627624 RepID=UPI001C62EC77|nr:resuscitation-promoting factor [Nocardioides panacisoli]QYJ02775.1 ubiquitin-like domain-containing protein [Nocardioides panacisoli]
MSTLISRLAASRAVIVATVAAVLLAVAGASYGYTALTTTVTLSVDGEEREVSVFGGDTVDDVLEAEGLEVSDRDVVSPALDSSVDDGSTVAVRYSRPLDLTVDGKDTTHWVTATSVDAALDQIGRSFDRGKLSVSRSADIDREGLELDVVTSKKITVELAGDKPKKVRVAARTVEGALDELGAKVGKRDEVKPGRDKQLKDGMTVVFNDKQVKKVSVEGESYEVDTVTRENDSMTEGTEKVVDEGSAGTRDATYRVVRVNGDVTERKLLNADVVTKAQPRIVEVGTKPEVAPATGPVNLSGVWARLAQCESGGNPGAVNPAGPYYGLYQFTASTWRSVGGSGLPHQASPAEQTKRAQILQQRSGWGQWPACASKLGLR